MDMILNDLGWRYATKQFDSEKKLSDEQLDTIKEVLRMTPSSFGLQPWKFVFVENSDTREKLKAAAWGQSQVTDASHLLVLCRENNIDQNLVDNFFEDMKKIGKTISNFGFTPFIRRDSMPWISMRK